jgi:hypothetical protein
MSHPGSDADDFDRRLHEQQLLQHEAIRREAFVQGFIVAKDPKTASATLMLLPEADAAHAAWRATRSTL